MQLLKEHYRFILLCCLLGFLEFRIVAFIHQWNFEDVVRVSLGPVDGTAYWRAFQNKLLSGLICRGIAEVLQISDRLAFILFGVVTLAATNIMSYAASLSLTGSRLQAAGYAGCGAALFVALQDGRWIMGWDFLDLFFFAAFAYGIASERRWMYFLGIYLPALFTRETALFIPLWFVLRALFERGKSWHWQAAVGGAALAAGAAVIKIVRDVFFVRSPYENIGTDEAHRVFGNFFTLTRNLADFADNILRFHFDLVSNLFVVLVVWWILRTWRRVPRRMRALAVLLLGMMASVFLVGIINETRNWLTMIPLFLVYAEVTLSPSLRSPGLQREIPAAGL
jgi:phage shock protein PspC (stress-responsive transcriptional regulator)